MALEQQKGKGRVKLVTYRYIKFDVTGNAWKATKETADVVGMYESDDEGLPQYVADLPLNMPGLEGLVIESL